MTMPGRAARGRVGRSIALAACFLGVVTMVIPEDAFGRGGRGGRGGGMARSSISAGGMNRARGGMNRQGASAGNRMSSRDGGRMGAGNRMEGAGNRAGTRDRPNYGGNRAQAGDRMQGGNRIQGGDRVQGGDRIQGGDRVDFGDIRSGNDNRINTGDINIDRGDWDIDIDDGGWDLGDNIGNGGLIAAGIVGATVGAIVAGSYYYALPPGCPLVHTYATPYYYCGGHYYSQRMDGDQVIYVVVEP